MTGSTLYEAVEQHALWNRLLTAVIADLDPTQSQKEVRDVCPVIVCCLTHPTLEGMCDGQISIDDIPHTR